MKVQVKNIEGDILNLTYERMDEWYGHWFVDENGFQWFAHNPNFPNSEDPIVALQYDYTIIQ